MEAITRYCTWEPSFALARVGCTRLFRFRDSLIMIGWEQRCATECGIGTSYLSKPDITIYAEPGVEGGIVS
ncbi:MAG: hypothetical protein H8E83_00320 [Planctomycetes bacterium]|nr:hypothetical protein [Planctomycetota bacterium]